MFNKSFKEFLLEMPENIPDTEFNLDNEQQNLAWGKEFRANRHLEKVKDLGEGFALYKVKSFYLVFFKDEPKLYYVMRYSTDRIFMINEVAASQIVVWSVKQLPVLNVPKLVFFEELLPAYHVIATDQQQTADGARFWNRRALEALAKELWVYYLDALGTPRKMVRITSGLQLSKLASNIWGNKVKHRSQRLLISDHQLKAKDGVEVED